MKVYQSVSGANCCSFFNGAKSQQSNSNITKQKGSQTATWLEIPKAPLDVSVKSVCCLGNPGCALPVSEGSRAKQRLIKVRGLLRPLWSPGGSLQCLFLLKLQFLTYRPKYPISFGTGLYTRYIIKGLVIDCFSSKHTNISHSSVSTDVALNKTHWFSLQEDLWWK